MNASGLTYPDPGYAYLGKRAPLNPGYRQAIPLQPDTHSKLIGYLFWLIGFTGAHRFYYGKQVSGTIWFLTFGLLGVGWLIDAFLIPHMDDDTNHRFRMGEIDYSLAWILLVFGGVFGLHRFVQNKWATGLLYLLTFGLFGIGVIFDIFTLNEQIDERHRHRQTQPTTKWA